MLVSIGLISYPLYLWHWPILSFLKIWYREDPPDNIKIVAILAAVVLSWLTYRFVEKPIRSARAPKTRLAMVIALLACATIVAAVSLWAIADNGVPQRYAPAMRAFLTFEYDSRANKPWRDGVCFLEPTDPATNWKDNCIDPPGPKPLVILWGDSHAAHLMPGLEALQPTRNFRLGRMTSAGCPPVFDFALPDHPSCPAENDIFFQKILAQHPDIVILDAAWDSYRFDGSNNALTLDQTRIFRGLDETIRRLDQAGIGHIILVGPAPLWREPLPDILTRMALANDGHAPASLGPQWRDEQIDGLEHDMRDYAKDRGLAYFSMVDSLCQSGQCMTMTGDTPQSVMVFDTSHLTLAGSRFVAQRMADTLLTGFQTGK
jgi:hypothetical protein